MNTTIEKLIAREILDSRGNPTIEVDIITNSGSFARASVPSGASTGEYEAIELRDKDNTRYLGKGVKNVVNNINTKIASALKGFDVTKQEEADSLLIALDGTENKSNLGANAILGTSMAIAYAGAQASEEKLFQYLSSNKSTVLPVPMMNILNGGSHADNSVDIQEFMVMPFGANNFSEALRMGTEIFHHLKEVLKSQNMTTSVGDEGGFAPDLRSNEEAIEVILEATEKAGLKPESDIYIALDVAASELFQNGKYNLFSEDKILDSEGMVEYLGDLVNKYPIVSIEDGLDENDWSGWSHFTKNFGEKVQITHGKCQFTWLVHLDNNLVIFFICGSILSASNISSANIT